MQHPALHNLCWSEVGARVGYCQLPVPPRLKCGAAGPCQGRLGACSHTPGAGGGCAGVGCEQETGCCSHGTTQLHSQGLPRFLFCVRVHPLGKTETLPRGGAGGRQPALKSERRKGRGRRPRYALHGCHVCRREDEISSRAAASPAPASAGARGRGGKRERFSRPSCSALPRAARGALEPRPPYAGGYREHRSGGEGSVRARSVPAAPLPAPPLRGPAALPPRGVRGRAGPAPLRAARRAGRALPPSGTPRGGAGPGRPVPARSGAADLAPPAPLPPHPAPAPRRALPMGSAARRRPGSTRPRRSAPARGACPARPCPPGLSCPSCCPPSPSPACGSCEYPRLPPTAPVRGSGSGAAESRPPRWRPDAGALRAGGLEGFVARARRGLSPLPALPLRLGPSWRPSPWLPRAPGPAVRRCGRRTRAFPR